MAEEARVIDDRGEKIDGLNDGKVVGEAIDGGIVAGFEAHNHVRIRLPGKPLEDCIEDARAQFGRTASGFSCRGQSNCFRHFGLPGIANSNYSALARDLWSRSQLGEK